MINLGAATTVLVAIGFPNGDPAITRTNHTNASGNGFIQTLRFKTSSTLNGSGNTSGLTVGITNATVISANETVIPINTVSDSLVVQDSLLMTAVNNAQALQEMIVFPNPTQGEFTIYNTEIGFLKIMNMLGEVVFTRNTKGGMEKINMKNTPDGLYFLQIETAKGTVTKKILKK